MWMVTNYILSLSRSRPDELRERYGSARDALAGLPHDHCARYLAHVQAEASALLGQKEAFLETWAAHARYFDGRTGPGEYFHDKDRRLLTALPKLAEDLARPRGTGSSSAFRKFRLRRRFRWAAGTKPEGRTKTDKTPWIYIAAGLLFMLMRSLWDSGPSRSGARLEGVPERPTPGVVDSAPFSLTARDLVARVTGSSSGVGFFGATGEVVNRSQKTYHFVIVRVEFLDSTGRAIAYLMTEGRGDVRIPPGGVMPFAVKGNSGLVFAKAWAYVAYSAEWK